MLRVFSIVFNLASVYSAMVILIGFISVVVKITSMNNITIFTTQVL